MKQPTLFVVLIVAWFACATVASGDDGRSTETQVFGVSGRGRSFVFVFDRSLSMQGAPLAAAKRELLASLSKLDRLNRFQIIFYNEQPKVMRSPQLLFADENGLGQAESFVSSITAAGGTDHLQALQLALRMQPDVIFLLTDADEPPLTANQLSGIHQKNAGTSINVIEFKDSRADAKRNFLQELAEENRGQYKRIDTRELVPDK